MNEKLRVGFGYDIDGTSNISRFGGPLRLLVPPPKNALVDILLNTAIGKKIKEPVIPKDFDPANVDEYIDLVSKSPGVGIMAQLHGKIAQVLNSDFLRPIKQEFPSVMTYNIRKGETLNIDALNFVLSGRPPNSQNVLRQQLQLYETKLNEVHLSKKKIQSHLWKFLGGFELAKKHNLDVIVQFDDDIYAALNFVLLNQFPTDQLKTTALAFVVENASTRLLTRKQRDHFRSLGIFFVKDLLSGAQYAWKEISTGDYKKYKRQAAN